MGTHGGKPYPDKSIQELYTDVPSGYTHPCPMECPEQLYTSVVVPCLSFSAADRPSFSAVYDQLLALEKKTGESEPMVLPMNNHEAINDMQDTTIAFPDENGTAYEYLPRNTEKAKM